MNLYWQNQKKSRQKLTALCNKSTKICLASVNKESFLLLSNLISFYDIKLQIQNYGQKNVIEITILYKLIHHDKANIFIDFFQTV